MNYSNKYGTAVLTPLGSIIHVSDIVGSDVVDAGYGFDTDTAEKLALITENVRLQPSFNMARRQWYVVYHHTSNTVQVCRLDELTCTEDEPRATLARLNNYKAMAFA